MLTPLKTKLTDGSVWKALLESTNLRNHALNYKRLYGINITNLSLNVSTALLDTTKES